MTPARLLASLRARGVALQAEGDRLRWRAPRGVVTEPDLEALRAAKPALLAALTAEEVLGGRVEDAPTLVGCPGCGRPMPATGWAYCAACDLGLDEPAAEGGSALALDAEALRAERGPAGGRGLRQEEIAARAAARKERRRSRRTLH